MRSHRTSFPRILATALSLTATAAGVYDAFETIDYSGHLTVAGKPFTGKGNFKFAIVQRNGARLWTSGDNGEPIEEGVPSGSVTVLVRDGSYHVPLGDPTLGMKKLPSLSVDAWEGTQVGIWFDDGKNGWSFLGHFNHTASMNRAPAAEPAAPGSPHMDAILTELRALRTEVAELRRQLALSGKNPAPAASASPTKPTPKAEVKPAIVMVREANRHTLGMTNAPLVLVEFTDYECGFCKRFFEQTFPLLKKEYIDTGRLRFVSRNMPVQSHPCAEPAALALLDATERADDDYWKMRSWLFGNQQNLGPAALAHYAEGAGLDREVFLADMTVKKHAAEIAEDLSAARAAGITATP